MPDLPEMREIPGCPCYLAGADGVIYSTKRGRPRPLSPRQVNARGYRPGGRSGSGRHWKVRLYLADAPERRAYTGRKKLDRWRDAYVHRLVALAWHGPAPSPDHLVRHRDDNPDDNRPQNLAWGTVEENMRDRKWFQGLRRDGVNDDEREGYAMDARGEGDPSFP